jgi:sec-independent protein translocase protein TatB
MFDIGWSELLVIGVVALIVIGPKELPTVLRAVGQWSGKIRRMAGEFQSQFQEAMREAEMADFKKQVDDLNQTARGLTSQFDPLDLKESSKWQPSQTAANSPPSAPSTPSVASPEPASPDPPAMPPAAADANAAATPKSADAVPSPEGARGETGNDFADAPPSVPSPGSRQA